MPPRVEAVWRAVDGLIHRSKWHSRSGIWEKSNGERRGKREERREKRDGSVRDGRDALSPLASTLCAAASTRHVVSTAVSHKTFSSAIVFTQGAKVWITLSSVRQLRIPAE